MGSKREGRWTSRVGGEPTVVGDPDVGRQLALAVDELPGRDTGNRVDLSEEVLPGAVLVPGWLDHDAQRGLVEDFRRWALPPAGLRRPRMPTGHLMSVQS